MTATNDRITFGSPRVSPYRNEIGFSSGPVRTNASTTPPGTPDRRISRATGITPSEQTGRSMPAAHPRTAPRHPVPNTRRVAAGPTIRRRTPAMMTPASSVSDASMPAWQNRRMNV